MDKVAVIIINYNGEKDTLECLNSLKKIIKNAYELVVFVVDNGSNSKFKVQSSLFAREASKVFELKIIRSEVNLGFSGGNNLGIHHAIQNKADYILFLNNDTLVHKNFIIELLKVIKQDPRIGIAVPKIYFERGYEFHKDLYKSNDLGKVLWYAGGVMDLRNVIGHHRGVDEVDNGQYDKEQEIDYATGCCILIKKEILEKIGLFDEKYYLYYEDSDLSQRVRQIGYKIVYVPKAIIWHKNAGSAGGSGSNLQDYFITRNRLLFGMRYAPLKSKIALIREGLGLLIRGRFWQRKGVLDFYFRRFGKGSYRI